MATATTVKEKMQGLITKANETTGANSTTLTDAVNALIEGYGAASAPCTHVPNMVPNDGSYVHKVYLNLNLPADQCAAILATIPDECYGTYIDDEVKCPVLQVQDRTYINLYKYIGDDTTQYNYTIEMVDTNWGNQAWIGVWCASDGSWHYMELSGDFPDALDINSDTRVYDEFDSQGRIGTANHLLTNLFSIRPFTANE